MVRKIKKILVPLDGSKNSLRGLDEAIYMARQCHATITAVYAKHYPPGFVLHPLGFIGIDFKKEGKKILDPAKTRAAKHGILLTSKIIGSNDPRYDIVRFAHSRKNKFDLIVIGARGNGIVKDLFFGSVSDYVLHKSKIPTLVVK
ncbi:MAG: Universal stress protein [Nitrosopumilales archaeon]|nr:MAG: Universal stress protein [Nitrosopumilales archaeon]